jgi:spore coat protein U-like protein
MSRAAKTSESPPLRLPARERWQDDVTTSIRPDEAGTRRATVRFLVGAAILMLAMCNDAWGALDCTVTTPGVAFGNYDATLPGPTDITGNLTVTCTRAILDPWTVSYSLTLSRGSSGSYSPRQMASGPSRLDYNLYRDAARSQVWGDGTASTAVVNATMNFNFFQFSKSATHTTYGRVPAGQGSNAGSYTDNIVVTITF